MNQGTYKSYSNLKEHVFEDAVFYVPEDYDCRKYFGVADGAYLYSDKELKRDLHKDNSFNRYEFLMGRFEKVANEFYPQYVINNKRFTDELIKFMSPMTENIMCSLDFDKIKKVRTDNFSFLHENLKNINKLKPDVPEGAFAYPLLIENGDELRQKLQKEKIYIPTLWPAVFEVCKENELEYQMSKNILPLPVDQRYGQNEMTILVEKITNDK